jgi:hypothetical protein
MRRDIGIGHSLRPLHYAVRNLLSVDEQPIDDATSPNTRYNDAGKLRG